MRELQDQHADLLGLVAQQEVELSVFRCALEDRVGSGGLVELDSKAKHDALDRYGTYVSFRN